MCGCSFCHCWQYFFLTLDNLFSTGIVDLLLSGVGGENPVEHVRPPLGDTKRLGQFCKPNTVAIIWNAQTKTNHGIDILKWKITRDIFLSPIVFPTSIVISFIYPKQTNHGNAIQFDLGYLFMDSNR